LLLCLRQERYCRQGFSSVCSAWVVVYRTPDPITGDPGVLEWRYESSCSWQYSLFCSAVDQCGSDPTALYAGLCGADACSTGGAYKFCCPGSSAKPFGDGCTCQDAQGNNVAPVSNRADCAPEPAACTSDAWSCTWGTCSSDGTQTGTCSLTDTTCTNPDAVKPAETRSCTPPDKPICTWTCTPWSDSTNSCGTRTCTLIEPNCVDGTKDEEVRSCPEGPPLCEGSGPRYPADDGWKCSDRECSGCLDTGKYNTDWTCPGWLACKCKDPATYDPAVCDPPDDGGGTTDPQTPAEPPPPPPPANKCWKNPACNNAPGEGTGATKWGKSGKTNDCYVKASGNAAKTGCTDYGLAKWSCGTCCSSYTKSCGGTCDSTGYNEPKTVTCSTCGGCSCTPTHRDYDESAAYCTGLTAPGCSQYQWLPAGEAPIGQYTSTGQVACCGDDSGENSASTNVMGTIHTACCASSNSCVGPDGTCNSCTPEITGSVVDSNNVPITNAKIDILAAENINIHTGSTTVTNALREVFTDSAGNYKLKLNDKEAGTFTIVASKTGYTPLSKDGKFITFYTQNSYNFVLGFDPTKCQADCTFTSDNVCHATCDGYNGCGFFDSKATEICDNKGKGFILDYDGTNAIQCCTGAPAEPLKQLATTVIDSENIVRIIRPVLYQGVIVKMVLDIFE